MCGIVLSCSARSREHHFVPLISLEHFWSSFHCNRRPSFKCIIDSYPMSSLISHKFASERMNDLVRLQRHEVCLHVLTGLRKWTLIVQCISMSQYDAVRDTNVMLFFIIFEDEHDVSLKGQIDI